MGLAKGKKTILYPATSDTWRTDPGPSTLETVGGRVIGLSGQSQANGEAN